jgi:hypothetical protein
MLISLSIVSCSSVVTNPQVKVDIDRDATITTPDGHSIELKQGKIYKLKDKPVLVEAPGRVGLLLIPRTNNIPDVHLSLRSIEEWGGASVSKYVDASFNYLLANINEVRQLLESKMAADALRKVEMLEWRYPSVSYLKFLKASCLVVLGDIARAKEILKKALEEFPQNREGQDLYKLLQSKTTGESDK